MIGGLDLRTVSNTEFTYTQLEHRIHWTKNAYPIGQYLIPCVRNIPWLDYHFNARTQLWATKPENHNNSAPVEKNASENCIGEDVPILADIKSEPYYFFGGCVYEILNALEHSKVEGGAGGRPIDLRKYVDPTGDIDVRIAMPQIQPQEERPYDFSDYLLNGDGTRMNAVLDHYTRWVYTQLKTQIQTMPMFDKLFENTVAFHYAESPEAADSDLYDQIGNIWIVRTPQYKSGMVKIQLIVKFNDTEVDHILELVLPIETNCAEGAMLNSLSKQIPERFMLVNGFRLESFPELIKGNISGMTARKQFYNQELRHKFYNHVGRIQYLNHYLNNNPPLAANFSKLKAPLLNLFYYLYEMREKGELCHFSHNNLINGVPCTPDIMMRSLVEYLVRLTPIDLSRIYISSVKKSFPVKEVIDNLRLSGGGRGRTYYKRRMSTVRKSKKNKNR